jgi:hypothetical protein
MAPKPETRPTRPASRVNRKSTLSATRRLPIGRQSQAVYLLKEFLPGSGKGCPPEAGILSG